MAELLFDKSNTHNEHVIIRQVKHRIMNMCKFLSWVKIFSHITISQATANQT